MKFSEESDKIIPAFVAAQSHFKKVGKGKINKFFNTNYADLAAFIDAISPGLTEHGLALLQDQTAKYETLENPSYDPNWQPKTDKEKNGRQPSPKIIVARINIQTWLFHESGQHLESDIFELLTSDSGVQGIGKVITYGRRYQLQTLLGLASEDNDENTKGQDQTPDDSLLDKTALRRYRADLNKRLQACKTTDEWNQQMDEFQGSFEYPIETLTRIRKGETFQSLSAEHLARITEKEEREENQPKPEDELKRLIDLANDEENFRVLEMYYLEHDELFSEENEKSINIIGAGLELDGYTNLNQEETHD